MKQFIVCKKCDFSVGDENALKNHVYRSHAIKVKSDMHNYCDNTILSFTQDDDLILILAVPLIILPKNPNKAIQRKSYRALQMFWLTAQLHLIICLPSCHCHLQTGSLRTMYRTILPFSYIFSSTDIHPSMNHNSSNLNSQK